MADVDIMRKHNISIVGTGTPTLVFGHGFGSDQTAWRYQVEAFSAQHQIVLFDHLGCGNADVSDYHPRTYNSLERYAHDLLQIYSALGLSDSVYIGHSAGAMIGMLASLSQPSLFAKLISIGASPRYLNDDGYIGGFSHDDLNTLYTVMADDYLGWANGFGPMVMAHDEQPELGREFARGLASMRPDIAQSVARVIFESDVRSRLALIQVPVLLLQTRHDLVVPQDVAYYLQAHIQRSQLQILDAQGHFPHMSAATAVTAAIRGFLALQ